MSAVDEEVVDEEVVWESNGELIGCWCSSSLVVVVGAVQ